MDNQAHWHMDTWPAFVLRHLRHLTVIYAEDTDKKAITFAPTLRLIPSLHSLTVLVRDPSVRGGLQFPEGCRPLFALLDVISARPGPATRVSLSFWSELGGEGANLHTPQILSSDQFLGLGAFHNLEQLKLRNFAFYEAPLAVPQPPYFVSLQVLSVAKVFAMSMTERAVLGTVIRLSSGKLRALTLTDGERAWAVQERVAVLMLGQLHFPKLRSICTTFPAISLLVSNGRAPALQDITVTPIRERAAESIASLEHILKSPSMASVRKITFELLLDYTPAMGTAFSEFVKTHPSCTVTIKRLRLGRSVHLSAELAARTVSLYIARAVGLPTKVLDCPLLQDITISKGEEGVQQLFLGSLQAPLLPDCAA